MGWRLRTSNSNSLDCLQSSRCSLQDPRRCRPQARQQNRLFCLCHHHPWSQLHRPSFRRPRSQVRGHLAFQAHIRPPIRTPTPVHIRAPLPRPPPRPCRSIQPQPYQLHCRRHARHITLAPNPATGLHPTRALNPALSQPQPQQLYCRRHLRHTTLALNPAPGLHPTRALNPALSQPQPQQLHCRRHARHTTLALNPAPGLHSTLALNPALSHPQYRPVPCRQPRHPPRQLHSRLPPAPHQLLPLHQPHRSKSSRTCTTLSSSSRLFAFSD